MTTPQPPAQPGPLRLLHLLWAIPLSLGVTLFGAFWMALNWCGISGCSGGGYGRISDPSLPGVLFGAAMIALTWFVLLTAAPWRADVRRRMRAGAIVGVLVALVMTFWATDGFVR